MTKSVLATFEDHHLSKYFLENTVVSEKTSSIFLLEICFAHILFRVLFSYHYLSFKVFA